MLLRSSVKNDTILAMVKIRLSQTGTKNSKKYRLIAIDESKRRNGSAIEILGYYDPMVKPAKIVFKKDRIKYWISVGAQMTDTAKKLIGTL
jgi:small subunit ribosomal protein S16